MKPIKTPALDARRERERQIKERQAVLRATRSKKSWSKLADTARALLLAHAADRCERALLKLAKIDIDRAALAESLRRLSRLADTLADDAEHG